MSRRNNIPDIIKESLERHPFYRFLRWIFSWLAYFIRGKTNLEAECEKLDACPDLVELDKELRAVHERRTNSHVLKKVDEYVYNECIPKLPLVAFGFDSKVAAGRPCYMSTPVVVWVNNQNQNLNAQMYVFRDAIHFVGAGHFSYSFDNILDMSLSPSWDKMTLTIRGRSKGVKVYSDTVFISYKILKKLL